MIWQKRLQVLFYYATTKNALKTWKMKNKVQVHRKSINLYKTTDGIICWSLNYTTDKSVQTNVPSESSATLRAKQQTCMHYLSSWDSEGQLWTSGQRLKMILQWPNAKMMKWLELLICYINICHCGVGHFHMCCTYVSLKTGKTHIYTKKKSFNDV